MNRLEFKVPDIGEGLSEVEVMEWLVAPGDRVRADQPIVTVQTDKAAVEIPAPAAGTITETRGSAGDLLPVGSILAVLDTEDASEVTNPSPEPIMVSPPRVSESPAASSALDPTPNLSPVRVLASPSTRKLALDLRIDLASVGGTGPGGRVTRSDVQKAVSSAEVEQTHDPSPVVEPAVPSAADTVIPLRGIRRQIARTMTQSWQQIPHVTEMREMDASELVRTQHRLREHLNARNIRLSFVPFFVKAVAHALRRHPSFNASIDMEAETITHHARCNIGVAVSLDEGLVVPVVRDADRASLTTLAGSIEMLSSAARDRTLTSQDTQGATFTVTNYGSFGVWLGTPIIRPPEVAIAGFGRIREAVIPVQGEPAVRPVLPIAVSADHRLNDGRDLAAFVDAVTMYLSEPILLLGDP